MVRKDGQRWAGKRGLVARRRERKAGDGCVWGRGPHLERLERRLLLSLNPFISEVEAGNTTGITDTAGDAADWLEICNPDPQTAVNLSGWSLKYQKTGSGSSTTWNITTNVVLGPGESRVFFCDSASATDPVQELHTNFNLSKSGATVQLIGPGPSSLVVSSLTYPSLNSNTSYGPLEMVTETDLVSAGVTATYYCPTSNSLGLTWTQPGFNDSSWASGPTGLGFANTVSGFACTLYKANVSATLATVEAANAVISTPAEQTSVVSQTESVLNFLDNGGDGHFGSDGTFPGMTITGAEHDNYVLQATGTIIVTASQAGYYTFGVNSDDGFSLTITGASFANGVNTTTCSGGTMAYDAGRAVGDSLATTYLAAGSYPVSLVYFQGAGGASMEFFAAKESTSQGVTSFDATNSQLVGDTAHGGLAVTSAPFVGTANSGLFAAAVATNVNAAVQSAISAAGGTSLYTRITFDAANYASLSSLTLKMQYDDGYVAYLNGIEIASGNAPASPTWNSLANEEQNSDVQATTYQNVDVSSFLNPATIGHLTATGNVLAIQVLMSSTSDRDMLVVPELAQMTSVIGGDFIYSTPTPGAPNGLSDVQASVTFSQTDGFFYAPFQVTLTPDIAGAPIYYTTDNSVPSATNGTLYTGPITISTTTVLQTAMIVGGTAAPYQTETYVFPAAVAAQPAAPAGFPTTWAGNDGESVAADYAMSSVPGYTTQQIIDALSSLPTLSLVTTDANMFGPAGIYANPNNRALEVAGSLEYFNPLAGTTDWSGQIGVSMYGGVGRDPQYLKHGIQISFDQSTGPSYMNENIFGDGYLPNGLILRQGFNDGWAWGGANAQFIIDQWTRDVLTALGTQNTPGIWVQLFVNGLYWGVYNAVADINSNYAAYFFGGQKSDYDVYHYSSTGFEVKSGDMTEWNDLFNVARYGNLAGTGTASSTALADPTAYALMAQVLNLPSFCDYIITNYYGGNWDWDWHNYSAIYSKTAGTGLIFQDWDGEGNLQDPNTNITSRDTTGDPTELFVDLMANADFRQMFADHVYKDLNTVLSPAGAAAVYQKEANTISMAVIDESARWGNISGTQYTPANWTARLNWELGSYFPYRTATMFSQFQTAGMYPSLAPPTLSVNGTVENGGPFMIGDMLTMAASTGTIYYTIDGSDPRVSGGGVSATAIAYTHAITLTQGEEINARVLSGTTWSALNSAPFYVNLAPFIRITELMYDPLPATAAEIAAGYTSVDGKEDFEFVELQNIGSTTLPLQGLAFTNGVTFTFPNVSLAAGAYIIVCSDPAAFALRYGPALLQAEYGSGWLTKAGYSGHFNNGGEEVTLTAPNGGVIQDFTYSNSWYPVTYGGGFSLVARSPSQALALWNSSSGWEPGGTPNGTPGTAETVAVPLPGSVVVNEVLANPTAAPGDMIEFYNTTAQAINIGGWFVSPTSSNLMEYQIALGTVIAAYGYYVLTEDYNFGAPAGGDPGRLVPFGLDPDGCTVYLSNNYAGQPGGYQAQQTVPSMLPGHSYGLYTKSDGATNFTLLQTPTFGAVSGTAYAGAANSIPYVSPLVTDEIMYDPSLPTAAEAAAGYVDSDFEYIEVYNRSSATIALGDYYVAGGIGYTPGWLADGNLANNFTVSSIALTGTTATVTLNGTSTGLQNGDEVHIDGATASQYNGDFTIANVLVNSGAGTTTFTYTVSGAPASPAAAGAGQSLTAGKDSELETLESGATAIWSAGNLAAASYTVYAHLNLYDGDNNLLSDLDSSAQYTVTCGGVATTVLVNQNQIPATLSVTSLTYDNASGFVTAVAGNSLAAGSIVHLTGATPASYDGTFVVVSATGSTFTYALATGLNLPTATGTIAAGLNDVWISLGTYTTSGTVSVQLTRTTNAKPSEWTVAGGMELVAGQQTIVLGTPTFNSYAIQNPTPTLAPGQYAVVVSNYAAFEERYNPTGSNNILVLGVYSGHLNNGGDTVDIYQIGDRAGGNVASLNGYVASYRVDHVNYNSASPWPIAPDGAGPALIRVHTADYGNDAINWEASNMGGTPGQANLVMDATSPTVPSNLAGQALLSPTAEIRLTWSASTDVQSDVDHYLIYRNGSVIGTSMTASFADTTIVAGTNYTYTVTAVNRDGYASAQCVGIGIGLPSVISNDQPTSTQIEIYFSEPLTSSVASILAHYAVSGIAVSAVALARDNTKVTLTLSTAMATGTAYTVTMTNLTTVSGNQLPASQTFTFTYAVPAWTATIYQASVGVTSLASSQSVMNTPTSQSWSQVFQPATINFTAGSAAAGHYTNDALLPNQAALTTTWTNFVIAANASIYIPSAGNYTFDVDSDDGFSLTIAGATFTTLTGATNASQGNWMAYDGGRGNADTLGVAKFSSAGYYALSLVYFQNGGLASVEVSAAAGSYTAWNSSFKLVGDVANGGLSLGGAVVDTTTPPAPANFHAAVTANNTQVTLAWSPVTGLPSGVDHYNIYCNGSLYATSTTTSYTATSGISSQSRNSYQVTAVNFDGIEGLKSAAVTAVPAGIAAVLAPTTTSVQVQFTEPVDPVTAQNIANYSITNSNCTISAAVLQADGYSVILTTSALGSSSHTLTVSNVKTKLLSALPTNFLTATFAYASPGWSVTVYKANITLGSTITAAQTLVNTPSQQSWVTTEVAPYVNYLVSGADAHFTLNRTLPGTTMGTETDNFAVTATGTLVVPTAGTYTIGVNSDDGFKLTITGATFSSVIGEDGASNTAGTNMLQFNGGRGAADTLGVVTFTSAGNYAISLLWFQAGGGSECEVYGAAGSYTSFNSSMKLVGDTANGGLSMGSSYVAPAFTVGVNAESTGNTSPALTGTVTDPGAAVSVRVNGGYYAATNNGDGTWVLPAGKISPLGTGIYDVVATGISAAGIAAFDSTTNELSVDTTAPTAAFISPTSPTLSPVSSIAIQFSEPIANFTLQNLQLTLANGGPVASAALEGATLTSTDNQHWTIGNLTGLTTSAGAYVLNLGGLGSTITDTSGNPLVTNAGTGWTMANPAVQAINTTGATLTNSSTVQYAVTFNENVLNVQAADFALGTGGAGGTVVSVGGGGATYTVTVSVSGNGALGLNLVDDNSIVDQYGNPLGGPALHDGDFTGQFYTIDTLLPTVAIPPVSPNPVAGPLCTLTVSFNKVVTGFTLGSLSLTRDGGANLLPGAATLSTSDSITFSLGNLAGLTEEAGTYVLTVGAAGVTDQLGWALSAGASVSWSLNTIQTSGGDTLKLKANEGNPLQMDVFLDTDASTPSYSVDLAALGSLAISSTGGATALTLDFANGNPLGGLPAPAVSLDGGTFALTTAGQTSADPFALTLSNDAAVTFNSSPYLAALTINTGSAASLASGGGKVISIGLLTVAGTAKFDLADNDLIATNMSLADMQALIAGGQVWSSSAVASDGIMGLALSTGQSYHNLNGASTLFAGQVVAATDDLVMYTYGGDANMDGAIDLRDYLLLDAGYMMGGMLSGYNWGDFNYDGVIDGRDYAVIDASLKAQDSPLADGLVALHTAQFGTLYAAALAGLDIAPATTTTSAAPSSPPSSATSSPSSTQAHAPAPAPSAEPTTPPAPQTPAAPIAVNQPVAPSTPPAEEPDPVPAVLATTEAPAPIPAPGPDPNSAVNPAGSLMDSPGPVAAAGAPSAGGVTGIAPGRVPVRIPHATVPMTLVKSMANSGVVPIAQTTWALWPHSLMADQIFPLLGDSHGTTATSLGGDDPLLSLADGLDEARQRPHRAGAICYVLLVALAVHEILDLKQPTRGRSIVHIEG